MWMWQNLIVGIFQEIMDSGSKERSWKPSVRISLNLQRPEWMVIRELELKSWVGWGPSDMELKGTQNFLCDKGGDLTTGEEGLDEV